MNLSNLELYILQDFLHFPVVPIVSSFISLGWLVDQNRRLSFERIQFCKQTSSRLLVQSNLCVQRSPLGNGNVTVIYRMTAIYKGQLCRNHNIRQLEIFGICLVTGDTGLPLYTGPFYVDYHCLPPRHCFYPVNPKALAKMASIE